jgi:putative transposase
MLYLSTWRIKPMSKQRRRHSAEFKFQVALEAAKESKTISELASEHAVHPNQISQWKRQLLDEGSGVFSKSSADQQRRQESIQAELYEQIGRLKMELEWLKKKVT